MASPTPYRCATTPPSKAKSEAALTTYGDPWRAAAARDCPAWPGGVTVRALDSQFVGIRFDSRPFRSPVIKRYWYRSEGADSLQLGR